MNIVEITVKDNYLLHIKLEDGREGIFDVSPYLDAEAFTPLKEKNQFIRIHNGKYYVEWDCGADLSVDTIQCRWNQLKTNTQTNVKANS